MFVISAVQAGRGAVAHSVLSDLPEWFGKPASVADYVAEAETLPMLGAQARSGDEFVGFLSLKTHNPVTVEAYVLGVMREYHRRGCGRALFEAAESRLRAQGCRYLTVKTVAATNPDPNYAATRCFYAALGFEPIEVFPDLWDKHNPCLLMLKTLRR
jgi:ribosomal protein S18 acetylase RimI-like enzyme